LSVSPDEVREVGVVGPFQIHLLAPSGSYHGRGEVGIGADERCRPNGSWAR